MGSPLFRVLSVQISLVPVVVVFRSVEAATNRSSRSQLELNLLMLRYRSTHSVTSGLLPQVNKPQLARRISRFALQLQSCPRFKEWNSGVKVLLVNFISKSSQYLQRMRWVNDFRLSEIACP